MRNNQKQLAKAKPGFAQPQGNTISYLNGWLN